MTVPASDRFGNPIDPSAGYARGQILGDTAAEVRRMLHGRALVRARGRELGIDALYNLTGVTRAFPVSYSDVDGMRTQMAYLTNFDGRAEELGVRYAGGDPERHDACFPSRVSSALLATMLALAHPGDRVLSVVPAGVSHPSIQNTARIAGASFEEVRGVEAGLAALGASEPQILAITSITPQKYHFDEEPLRRLVAAGKAAGALVILDDAHGAVRTAFYRQAPALELGEVDVAVFSLDKHLQGPRTCLLVGPRETVETVRAQMFRLGVEAPFANYVAGLRAIEGYDPDAVRAAGEIAVELHGLLRGVLVSDGLYSTGPGVALSEDDLMSCVLRRAGVERTELVPMEISSLVAMRLVETSGFVTILAIGMPGAAASLRLLMFPDGGRAGAKAIAEATDDALSFAAAHVDALELARTAILG